ncbi:hypothetical protein P5673_018315, partial [Acropora cervicornis]
KATKRLYSLKVLRKAGVQQPDLVRIYCSLFQSVLEYGAPVWSALPGDLSNVIESVQRRELRIICPLVEYEAALISILHDYDVHEESALSSAKKLGRKIMLNCKSQGRHSGQFEARVHDLGTSLHIKMFLRVSRTTGTQEGWRSATRSCPNLLLFDPVCPIIWHASVASPSWGPYISNVIESVQRRALIK